MSGALGDLSSGAPELLIPSVIISFILSNLCSICQYYTVITHPLCPTPPMSRSTESPFTIEHYGPPSSSSSSSAVMQNRFYNDKPSVTDWAAPPWNYRQQQQHYNRAHYERRRDQEQGRKINGLEEGAAHTECIFRPLCCCSA